MKQKGIRQKDEVVRVAIREPSQLTVQESSPAVDFHSLIGLGLGKGMNPDPRFQSDNNLWS